MTTDCVFCRIAAGEIPARIVHEDERVVAFHDLAPKAPTHLLVIPRRHIATLAETRDEDAELLGRVVRTAIELAAQEGLDQGFRLVWNNGELAGQSVFHLHLHLLGGRRMEWPPG
jgi:histidine triad (HIT) family protein